MLEDLLIVGKGIDKKNSNLFDDEVGGVEHPEL